MVKTNSFLQDKFKEFYVELMNMVEAAKAGNWVYDDSSKKKDEKETMQFSSNAILQKLYTRLETQEQEASAKGGDFGLLQFQEAKYIMAAVADEIFLHLDWAGQANWKNYLLEAKCFQTSVSGEMFYQKLEKVLESNDPANVDLALLFLLALSLGFQGKYYKSEDLKQIDEYRHQLFTFVFTKKPELEDVARKLMPNTYENTLKKETKIELPGLKKWYGYLALLLLFLFILSFAVWGTISTEIGNVLEQIR